MHTSRNRPMHDKRRRIWSPAFSDKALRGYEKRVQKYNDLLIKQISAFSGKKSPLKAETLSKLNVSRLTLYQVNQ